MKSPIRLFTFPNILTSMNILCGSLATILALESKDYLIYAAILIAAAAVFDFLDGFSARLLSSFSAIGKDLDSLADMVSFGVAPAIIMYQLLKMSLFGADRTFSLETVRIDELIVLFSCILLIVFSGLRLAKFNVDTRQTTSFVGLPTPANAMLIGSIPLILATTNLSFVKDILLNTWVLLAITLFESVMLVAEYPMFALKFKTFNYNENRIRYNFIILSAVLLASLQFLALPIIIILYILISGINNWVLGPAKSSDTDELIAKEEKELI
jgi:CDP-diacylglycerol---serine O-phosphatidyltransferase